MHRRLLLAAALVVCSCAQAPSSVQIKITGQPADGNAAPLWLSVFDAHHALATHLSLGAKPLPLVAVAYNLPLKAELVRLVISRDVKPRQLGAATVTLVPHAQASVSVVLSATTPDKDGDGIPDGVDNCPDVPNPDQASASGGDGDACPVGDMAIPPPDLRASDLSMADLSQGGATVYNFNYTLPVHQSLYYGGHDKPPATITFSSNADSVSCSHNGVNFSPCDSATTIVFTPDDYNNGITLQVKLMKAGFAPYVATLNPKQLMPGLGFFNCDLVISSDETTSMFQQQLLANRVICLASLVNITDLTMHLDDAGMHKSLTGVLFQNGNATGMKILGTESNPPRFFNPDIGGDQGVLVSVDATVHDLIVANLNLVSTDGNPISFETNGGHNAFSNLAVTTTNFGGDQAVVFNVGTNTLYNVNVHVDNSQSTPGLVVGAAANVTFTGGRIFGRDDTNAVLVNGGTLAFVDSTVDNAAQSGNAKVAAVQVNGGVMTISGKSSVSGPNNDGIDINNGGRLSLSGTSVYGHDVAINMTGAATVTSSGATITTDGIGLKVNGATLTIDNTIIERRDVAGTSGGAIGVFTSANMINSSLNGNHFCDVNPSGANVFSGGLVLDAATTGMFMGTFVANKQVKMGAVDTCP